MTHMTLEEAQKIMGDDVPNMSEEELNQTIYDKEQLPPFL